MVFRKRIIYFARYFKQMIKPYHTEGSKKEQVAEMFNNIAPKYDFLNHFLSMGVDKIWRRKAINNLKSVSPKRILDIATGTGDLAIASLRLHPNEIIGVDISEEMLAIGRKKVEKKGLAGQIRFEKGDSEQLNFPEGHFDAAMAAFGVRNFENLQKGIDEIYRVLAPSGRLVVLEFSQPTNIVFKAIYRFYFFKILPFFGKLFSKDARAYTYLPESVYAFPSGNAFLEYMKKAGFEKVKCKTLTFGIASLYIGDKAELRQ
jgi:demethylmenaquinone methyltransferase/2-methoxy-6-polyprenyl-1,4-benzoquinol methylase